MSVALRIGAGLIAFSFPVFLIYFYESYTPHLVVISLISSVFWLCSFLIAGYASACFSDPGEFDWAISIIFFSSVLQETSRYLFIFTYRFAEKVIYDLLSTSDTAVLPIVLSDTSTCLAAGVGIGTIHTFMVYGPVFVGTTFRKGDYYSISCPDYPLIIIYAMNSLIFFVLDIFLMILAFHSNRLKSWVLTSLVFEIHIGAGLSTLSNEDPGGCSMTFKLLLFILLFTAILIGVYSRKYVQDMYI